MSKLKALVEQRNEKASEMETLLNTAKGEERAMSEEEHAKFTELDKEVTNLDKTIEASKRLIILECRAANEHKDDSKGEERAESEAKAFENYVRGVVSEERADINLTAGDNGAVIPSSIANKIIQTVYDTCPIYQMATRYNVGGTLTIPYYDEDTQAITMAYATEFTDLQSTSGKFASVELKGYLAGVLSKISKSLINNSQFDIVSFVITAMASSISRWIEKELLIGTTGKVVGMSAVSQSMTAPSATAVTADNLIDLQETIPDVYQAGAVWIMSKATRTAIRKLKDSQGDYILNKDATSRWGYTLFGKDIYTSDNMPDMAAGATAVYYGDMSGLAVKLTESVNIEVLREMYATQHVVGVVGWIEIDSTVENSQKIAKLVMASA